jgi:hypothetical protein
MNIVYRTGWDASIENGSEAWQNPNQNFPSIRFMHKTPICLSFPPRKWFGFSVHPMTRTFKPAKAGHAATATKL